MESNPVNNTPTTSDVTITVAKDFEGYIYSMKGRDGFGTVNIEVDVEVGGHGCLFGMRFPSVASKGLCWCGDKKLCCIEDFFIVLNRVLRDYHMSERVITVPIGS